MHVSLKSLEYFISWFKIWRCSRISCTSFFVRICKLEKQPRLGGNSGVSLMVRLHLLTPKFFFMYTVDYFINKFEAIPEKDWCTGALNNRKGAKCANGHCGVVFEGDVYRVTNESIALKELFRNTHIIMYGGSLIEEIETEGYSLKLAFINDGISRGYKQRTPKERVIAALKDIKRIQEEKQMQVVNKIAAEVIDIPLKETKKEHEYENESQF
jgi:hypothetical protein